jgi:hypothetical protein
MRVMSFANLAPIEKTENLIYSILPLSIATWYASTLELADPIVILGAIVAVSSFLSLLLYQLPIDQRILDEYLRRETRKRQSLSEALLIFNLLERRWEKELGDVAKDGEEDHLDNEMEKQVSIIVKNPHIRRETWRIRASAWLVLSFPFIILSAANYFRRILSDFEYNPWYLCIGCIVVAIVIISVTAYRHRNLTSHIDHLCRYEYLEKVIGLEQLENPHIFGSKPSESSNEFDALKRNLKLIQNQLSVVTEYLKVGDWSIFLDRWDRIYHWLHRRTVTHVESEMTYYLVKPFWSYYRELHQQQVGNPTNLKSIRVDSERELEWICYFYEKCKNIADERKQGKESNDNSELPLPEFDEEYDELKKTLCEGKTEFDNFDLLLTYSDKPSKVTRDSVGAAILWAFSALQGESKDRKQAKERGLELILDQFETNNLNISLNTVAPLVLSSFTDNGIGGSVTIKNTEILKGLKEFTPDDMMDNWAYAVIRHLKSLDEDALKNFIDDGNFVIEAGSVHPDIERALGEVLPKAKNQNHLRQLLRRIREKRDS